MNALSRPILLSTFILVSIGIGTAQMSIAAPWTIQQITHNDVNDRYPQSSGPDIVWQRHDSNDWEIIQYQSGVELPPITNNSVDDRYPTVAAGNIIWQQHDGADDELVVYNGTTSQQWTDNGRNDQYAHASGNIIVWEDSRTNPSAPDIYMYDILLGVETQISNGSVSQMFPSISGDRVVWYDFRDGINSIYLYDHSTGLSTAVVNDVSVQSQMAIFGDRIAWTDQGAGNVDIYLLKGDGVGDNSDKCPYLYDLDQSDTDGDGIGDACDEGGSNYYGSITHKKAVS